MKSSCSRRGVPLLGRSVLMAGLLCLGQMGSALSHGATATAAGPVTIAGSVPGPLTAGKATLVGLYNPAQMLRAVIALQPPHLADEEQFLKDVQNRQSPLFHHFLSMNEWNARFAPASQDEQAVVDWARSQGLTVTNRYGNRLLVDVAAPAAALGKAFNVSINRYTLNSATYYANDRNPTIPAHLAGIVQAVLGLNNFEVMHPASAVPGQGSVATPDYAAGPVIAPGHAGHRDGDPAARAAALQALSQQGDAQPRLIDGNNDLAQISSSYAYDWNALYRQGHCCNPLGNPGQSPINTSIAIATSGDFSWNDVLGFANRYGLAYDVGTWYIDGTPSCCELETTMDVEWAGAMSNSFGSYADTAKIVVYEGADSNFSTFADVYNTVLNKNETRIFSTSWGSAEVNYCSSGIFCTYPSLDSLHGIFDQMVGMGWTLTAASGDNGAYANCGSNLAVLYPASDPDVVAAGGTYLAFQWALNGNYVSGFNSETAWDGTGCTDPNNPDNAGGGGGGCSNHFGIPSYQTYENPCSGKRGLPDLSLNALSQSIIYSGTVNFVGGTSIVAPEIAGFFAVENAYLLSLGNICGGNSVVPGTNPCSPIGNANYTIYNVGDGISGPPHYPFYDVTSGCNGGYDTAIGYCAGPGYDLATGFGSFNALQLAWAFNWTGVVSDNGAPSVTFSGPAVNTWYKASPNTNWTIADSGGGGSVSGVAGFSQAWDQDPGDPTSHSTPALAGVDDSFYHGPQFPNATNGGVELSTAGQGCHTIHVRAWDNRGVSTDSTYGPLCYDTVAPVSTAVVAPAANGAGWQHTPVTLTLSATDPAPGSGVAGIRYQIGRCPFPYCVWPTYTAPLTFTASNKYTVYFQGVDNAGNSESVITITFNLDTVAPQTTATVSGSPAGGGAYLAPVTVSLSATDDLSGVAGTAYQVDGGPVTPYSGPFSVAALGTHRVTYHSSDVAGNVEATQSTSFTIVRSQATTTTLSGDPHPSTVGQTVWFTATVAPQAGSGIPTGNVTFKDGLTTLATVALNASGVATFSTSSLGVGTHSITAAYAGDATFSGSTSSVRTQVVQEATTTALSSSVNPSLIGQTVTFTATVTVVAPGSDIPTGTVTFKDGSTTLATVALTASGVATFSISSLAAGTHSITAAYAGDATFRGSTSAAVAQTVQEATTTTLTSSVNPAVLGQAVTFTATVAVVAPGSGIPTGNVTFKDGSTTLATVALTASGVAAFSTSSLGVGVHSITAAYAGSGNFNASTSAALSQAVNQANSTTTLTSSVNPSLIGQAVTFTAKVVATAPGSGIPTGNVTFKDGLTTLATVALNVSGVATFSISSLAAGTHSITAAYAGSGNFNASTSAALSQAVQEATTTTLSGGPHPSTVGQTVWFTATVVPQVGSGIPTGNVTFKDGLTTLATVALNASGVATFSTSSLGVGTHSITAAYAGDATFSGSTSSVRTQVVQEATTTTLTSSVNPAVLGQAVIFTATVAVVAPGSGIPTGNVTFKDGSTTLATVALNASGVAAFSTSSLGVGTHSITAAYAGSGTFNASLGTVQQVIQ